MGKFNSYAKMLDQAFKEARDAYAAVVGKLNAAKQEERRANSSRFTETYYGEHESRKAQAKANLLVVQNTFKTESKRIWAAYDAAANQIRSEFMEVVKRDCRANPDAIDSSGLELLKSGILTADDMEGLASRYDGNSTMMRLVSKYAAEAAEKETDTAERRRFLMIQAATKDGRSRIEQEFDTLVEIAKRCSGRSATRDETTTNPDFVVKMGQCWESLTADKVANF